MCAEVSEKRSSNISLDKMIREEVDVINKRRAAERPKIEVKATGSEAPVLDAIGLTLSGGGIRSASFSLGVLQALDQHGVLPRLDYLSTVSGGGYIGSSLSATMNKTGGRFVFGHSTGMRADARPADIKDSESVGHLRNYSNYLVPFGARDLITAAAIVLRGLVANASLVLPVVLLLAAVTILANPTRGDLTGPDFFGFRLTWLPVQHFGITLLLALVAFPLFFAWAIYRSRLSAEKQSEFRTWLPAVAATYLILIATSFFCELQPYVVAGMFDLVDQAPTSSDGDLSLLTAFVQRLATIAAPVAAIVTFFRQQIGTLLKSVTTSSSVMTKALAVGSHIAIWIAGAALPLLIWVAYLYLCYWGIINQGNPPAGEPARQQPAIHGTIQIEGPGMNLRGTLDCRRTEGGNLCIQQTPAAPASAVGPGDHTPKWLIRSADVVSSWLGARYWMHPRIADRPVTLLYVALGILLFGLSYLLSPNANSLHRLYRDRLSKAFLFDPTQRAQARANQKTVDRARDFAQLDTTAISGLADPPHSPYHLINAALNVQGSDYANRRGRNADFFLFSPLYVGSEATHYAATKDMERVAGLDLPTAMAISGAAFSSNMGSSSIRALTPTLALLNIRTGYWLKNPRCVAPQSSEPEAGDAPPLRGSKWYLWSEITGQLYEDSEEVYITDGGHIENLGIYELLRRRCKFIVAVDAEADPAMRLPSLITLQRYARIDLGVRINMPWDQICKTTRSWMGFDAAATATPSAPANGPHAAIGIIDYDGGEKGWILYIKSSLSGDENDYVRDYARRYGEFPHESTGDQFFSEEQFEVYRALGFHIGDRLLRGDDRVQVFGAPDGTTLQTTHPDVDPMRNALLGSLPQTATRP